MTFNGVMNVTIDIYPEFPPEYYCLDDKTAVRNVKLANAVINQTDSVYSRYCLKEIPGF